MTLHTTAADAAFIHTAGAAERVRSDLYGAEFRSILCALDASGDDAIARAAQLIRAMANVIRFQDSRIGGLLSAVEKIRQNRDRLCDENNLLRARLLLARRRSSA